MIWVTFYNIFDRRIKNPVELKGVFIKLFQYITTEDLFCGGIPRTIEKYLECAKLNEAFLISFKLKFYQLLEGVN